MKQKTVAYIDKYILERKENRKEGKKNKRKGTREGENRKKRLNVFLTMHIH